MQRTKTLEQYVGKNEKTKLVVKLQKVNFHRSFFTINIKAYKDI